MKTWFVKAENLRYECPYCHTAIINSTNKKLETHNEYCVKCSKKFRLEVIQNMPIKLSILKFRNKKSYET